MKIVLCLVAVLVAVGLAFALDNNGGKTPIEASIMSAERVADGTVLVTYHIAGVRSIKTVLNIVVKNKNRTVGQVHTDACSGDRNLPTEDIGVARVAFTASELKRLRTKDLTVWLGLFGAPDPTDKTCRWKGLIAAGHDMSSVTNSERYAREHEELDTVRA